MTRASEAGRAEDILSGAPQVRQLDALVSYRLIPRFVFLCDSRQFFWP